MIISYVKKFFWVVIASVLLTGCFEKEPQEQVHDVKWFMENNTQRVEMLTRCANNPGELRETPNCQNAVAAELKVSTKLPDITW